MVALLGERLLWRLLPLVTDRALGSCGDPEAGSALRDRNPDKEERVVTSGRDVIDLAREACVACVTKGDRWRIENYLRLRGGIAHQASGDCSDRAWRTIAPEHMRTSSDGMVVVFWVPVRQEIHRFALKQDTTAEMMLVKHALSISVFLAGAYTALARV